MAAITKKENLDAFGSGGVIWIQKRSKPSSTNWNISSDTIKWDATDETLTGIQQFVEKLQIVEDTELLELPGKPKVSLAYPKQGTLWISDVEVFEEKDPLQFFFSKLPEVSHFWLSKFLTCFSLPRHQSKSMPGFCKDPFQVLVLG